MIENLVSIAVWAGLMSLTFWLLGKYYPCNEIQEKSAKSFEELRNEFWKFDLKFLLLFVLLTPIFTVVSYKCLGWFSDLRFSNFSNDGFLVLPERLMWFLPSIFMGLSLAGFVFFMLRKPVLKSRYQDYIIYSNMKYGFDAEKASKILTKVLLVFVTVFVILGINYFAYFGKDKIVISNFLQLSETTYEYEEITAIKSVEKLIAPNGNVVVDKHYIIDFADTSKWNSRQSGISGHEKVSEVVSYIVTKTGLKLKQLEFDK